MKNRIFKILSVLLSVALVFSVCVISASANDTEIPTYYVNAGGVAAEGGDGSGKTLADAARSITTVLGLEEIQSLNEQDTINIKIVGSSSEKRAIYTLSKYTDSTTDNAANGIIDETTYTHKAKVVISPYDTEMAYIHNSDTAGGNMNVGVTLAGPTEFKSTDFRVHNWSALACAYNSISFDSNSVLNATAVYMANIAGNANTHPGQDLIFGKVTGQINVTNSNHSNAGKWSGDVNIVVNNSDSTPTIVWGQSQGSSVTFQQNFNIDIKSAKSFEFKNGTLLPTVTGNLVAVINAGTIQGTDILGNVTAAKKWIISNNTTTSKATVSATATEGEFSTVAPVGYAVYATSGENTVDADENGILNLDAGTWEVATKRVSKTLKYFVSPTGDDTNNTGLTYDSPLKTVDKAVELANKDTDLQAIDIIEVNLVDATETAAILSEDGSTTKSIAKLVIQPYGEGVAKLISNNQGETHLYADTEFKSISLDVGNNWLYAVNNDVIFDENSQLVNGSISIGSKSVTNNNYTSGSQPDQKLILKNKFANNKTVSFPSGNYAAAINYTNKIDFIIDNPDNTLKLSFGQGYGESVTVANMLNYDVKAAKSITVTTATYKPVINGTLQMVINADTIDVSALSNLTYGEGSKKWIVLNSKGIDGLISSTETAGTFKIADGYKVTLSDGTNTQTAEKTVTLANGTWNVTVVEELPETYTYYVAPNGTGKGLTKDDPAASVKDVVEAATAAGAKAIDTIDVKIVGSSAGSAATNYAVFVKPYKDSSDKDTAAMTAHEAKLVISPCDTEIAYLSNDWNGINTAFQLGGPTEFKSVNLHVHQYSEFLANGYDVSFDSNCAINNRIISAGKASYTKYSFVDKAQKLTFENALNNTIAFPNNGYVSNSTDVNFTKEQNIIVDNTNTVATIMLGNNGTGGSAGLSGVLNIDVKSAKSIAFAKGNHPLDITGTLQVVVNADTIDVTALADFATAENAKKYIVTNATGIDGLISMTDTVGTYKIADGYEIIAVNGNTTKTATGSIELDAGTWNIVIAQTVTVTGGTADVEEAIPGATVTLTPNAPAKYMEFAGWEIVSGDATVDGNTLTMGNQAVEVKAIYKAIPAFMDIRDLVRFNECGGTDAIGEEFEGYLGMEGEVLSLQLIRNWLLNAE